MAVVGKIRIETTLLPPMDIDLSDRSPSPLLEMLKPRITIDVLGAPVVIAPYGDPGPSQWGSVKWGAILGGIAVGLLAISGARSLLARSK